MTVKTTEGYKIFSGDATTTEFTFYFPSFEASWIFGLVDRVPMPGSAVLYSDQNNSPGGVFTFDTPPSLDSEVVIIRETDFLQETDYPAYTRFPSRDHEEALDKLTMICQQLDFHIDRLEADALLFVLRSGDTMGGHLHLLATEAQPSTVAARKDYVDTANSILFNKMALKTVNVVSGNQQTLQVANPTLADDVTLTPRTNVGNGLVQLLPTAIIPSNLLPEVGGGALTFLGLHNASTDTLPPDGTEMGDAYLISEGGTLLLRDSNTGDEISTDAVQNDTIIWYSADNEQGLPEGWYFYNTGSGSVTTTAAEVTLDDSSIPIAATNVQEGFDDLLNTYLSNYNNAVFNGSSPDFVAGSYSSTLRLLNSDGGNISLIQGIDGTNRRTLALYGGSSPGTGSYIYIGGTIDPENSDSIKFGIPSGVEMTLDSDGVTVNDLTVENVLSIPNPFTPANSGRIFSAGASDRHFMSIQSGLGTTQGAYMTLYGANDGSFPNSIIFSTPTSQPLRITNVDVLVRDENNQERKAGWKPSLITTNSNAFINSSHIMNTLSLGTSDTLTIPAAVGQTGDIVQVLVNEQAVSFNAGSGVTLEWVKGGSSEIGDRVVDQNSIVTLFCAGSNSWKIWGVGIS